MRCGDSLPFFGGKANWAARNGDGSAFEAKGERLSRGERPGLKQRLSTVGVERVFSNAAPSSLFFESNRRKRRPRSKLSARPARVGASRDDLFAGTSAAEKRLYFAPFGGLVPWSNLRCVKKKRFKTPFAASASSSNAAGSKRKCVVAKIMKSRAKRNVALVFALNVAPFALRKWPLADL